MNGVARLVIGERIMIDLLGGKVQYNRYEYKEYGSIYYISTDYGMVC